MGKIKAKDSCKSEIILAWPLLLQITQLCLFLSYHTQSFLPCSIVSLCSFVIQVSMYSNLLSSLSISFHLVSTMNFPFFLFPSNFLPLFSAAMKLSDRRHIFPSHNSHCLSTTVQKSKGSPKSSSFLLVTVS